MSASSARVLFPSFFTFACFAVFLWPLVQTVSNSTRTHHKKANKKEKSIDH